MVEDIAVKGGFTVKEYSIGGMKFALVTYKKTDSYSVYVLPPVGNRQDQEKLQWYLGDKVIQSGGRYSKARSNPCTRALQDAGWQPLFMILAVGTHHGESAGRVLEKMEQKPPADFPVLPSSTLTTSAPTSHTPAKRTSIANSTVHLGATNQQKLGAALENFGLSLQSAKTRKLMSTIVNIFEQPRDM